MTCAAAFLLLMLFPPALAAQPATVPPQAYYTGVGEAADLARARASATSDLVERIQAFVSESRRRSITEDSSGLSDRYDSRVLVRSALTLKDVGEEITRLDDGRIRVVRYVTKEFVRDLYNQRKARIRDELRLADEALAAPGKEPLDLGSALKHYYWASLLAAIHPDTVCFVLNGAARTVTAAVPSIIEKLIRGIRFRLLNAARKEATVWRCAVEWNGKPVSALRFQYYDGVGQTLADVVNGETKLAFYFPDGSADEREVLLNIDYRGQDGMDDLLAFADSVKTGSGLENTVVVRVPGSGAPIQRRPPAAAAVTGTNLPRPVAELLGIQGGFREVMAKMDSLVRNRRIIVGSAREFPSLDGLYGAVVSSEGLIAVIRCQQTKFYEVPSGREVAANTFAGKRIAWIEVVLP